MINKPYFYRYRHALEQDLSNKKTEEIASENEGAFRKNSALNESAETLQNPAGEQSTDEKEEAFKWPAGGSAIPGFEQIAPGMFQFNHQRMDKKVYAVPPGLYPPYQFNQPQSQKAGELGFKRVDGLPGPYQHYVTPVFQFT